MVSTDDYVMSVTSNMISHRGASLSEHVLLIESFVMAHKSWITAGFVTVCCSMSMVSKTSCSHFACQGSYYATQRAHLD